MVQFNHRYPAAMRRLLLLLLLALPLAAQVSDQSIVTVTVDPAGACGNGVAQRYNRVLNKEWACSGGVWTQLAGTGSGTTLSGSSPQIPYISGANALTGETGTAVTQQLAQPAAPTVTVQGTTGATTWAYCITGLYTTGNFSSTNGTSKCSAVTSVANGNATLTGSNFNRLTFSGPTGADSCRIYRTTAGGTPNTTGVIADQVPCTTFDDTATAIITNQSPPTLDGSGLLRLNNRLIVGNVADTWGAVPEATITAYTLYDGNFNDGDGNAVFGYQRIQGTFTDDEPLLQGVFGIVSLEGTAALGAGQSEANGAQGYVLFSSSGSPAAPLTGVKSQFFGFGSGNPADLALFRGVYSNSGPGAPVSLYGLKLPDISNGSSGNWAIKTGLGKVEFGDLLISSGAAPVVSGCTSAAIVANSTMLAGQVNTTPTGACVLTLTFPRAAPHGWNCAISNMTTANLIRQTATTTTTAVFTGVTVANDVLSYGPCVGW